MNDIIEGVELVYLPPNVTALIQPMDQGPISLMRKHYKKNLLRNLIFADKLEIGLMSKNLILVGNHYPTQKLSNLLKRIGYNPLKKIMSLSPLAKIVQTPFMNRIKFQIQKLLSSALKNRFAKVYQSKILIML